MGASVLQTRKREQAELSRVEVALQREFATTGGVRPRSLGKPSLRAVASRSIARAVKTSAW